MRKTALLFLAATHFLACSSATPNPDAPPSASGEPAASPAEAPAAPAAASAGPVAPPAAAPPAAASASPDKAPLLGKLGDAEVQATLGKNYTLFDPCYPEAFKKKGGTLKVQVTATIGPSGKVNWANVTKTSKDAKVDACVVDAFKRIPFPQSKEGSARVNPVWIELGGETVMK